MTPEPLVKKPLARLGQEDLALRHTAADARRLARRAEEERQPTRRLYHRTVAAKAILLDGFRDGTGTYLTWQQHVGVWFSNDPLDANEGVSGDEVIEVTAPAALLASFEWVEEHKPYREWLIPATLANTWPRRLVSEAELDDLAGQDWIDTTPD